MEYPYPKIQFRSFIKKVNEYLIDQKTNRLYHGPKFATNTPQSFTFADGVWTLIGKRHVGNEPYVDEVTVMYCGRSVWGMTRQTTYGTTTDSVKLCMREVAKNYDKEKPWCGPSELIDKKTGMKYQAEYTGTEAGFTIEETITDTFGKVIYSARCEGGYI